MLYKSYDRILCKDNIIRFFDSYTYHHRNQNICPLSYFVKEAIELSRLSVELSTTPPTNSMELYNYKIRQKIINKQWKQQVSQQNFLEEVEVEEKETILSPSYIIPIIDFSDSMFDVLYTAIGLALKLSEFSFFKKKIMTFSSYAQWCNLENETCFIEMVKKIKQTNDNIHLNSNLFKVFELFLDSFLGQTDLQPYDISNINLVIFSNMFFDKDEFLHNDYEILIDNIKKLFHNVGMYSSFKTPFPIPNIIFWNLKFNNTQFVSLSNDTSCSMISGYSFNSFSNIQFLFNHIRNTTKFKQSHNPKDKSKHNSNNNNNNKSNKKHTYLHPTIIKKEQPLITPFHTLLLLLNNPRYDIMEFIVKGVRL